MTVVVVVVAAAAVAVVLPIALMLDFHSETDGAAVTRRRWRRRTPESWDLLRLSYIWRTKNS